MIRALPLVAVLLAGAPANNQDMASEVDKIFSWAEADAPGCACAVAQNGKLVVSRAYGAADLERGVPLSTASIFDAGSRRRVRAEFRFRRRVRNEIDGRQDHEVPPRQPVHAHTGALKAFAGRFVNGELGTVFVFEPKGDVLTVHLAHAPERTLEFSNPIIGSTKFTRLGDT